MYIYGNSIKQTWKNYLNFWNKNKELKEKWSSTSGIMFSKYDEPGIYKIFIELKD